LLCPRLASPRATLPLALRICFKTEGEYARSGDQHYFDNSFTMLYLSAGNAGNARRNRQTYSSTLPLPPPLPHVPALIPRPETRSARGPTISFSPPILDLVFEPHTNYFMDSSLSDSGVTEDNLFTNSISIDTDLPLNPRRRKRTSPVTPSTTEIYPGQFSQSLAGSQESPDYSRISSSSNPQPGVFDAFGPLPMELSISPSLAPSHQLQRSRSASQNLHPSSHVDSSRNPSPRPSSSSAPARTDRKIHGSGSTEPPPKKKRRRQALSCTECKRRKIRCDRVQPCAPCQKRGEGDKCRWHILEPVCVCFLLISLHTSILFLRPRDFRARVLTAGFLTETSLSRVKSMTRSRTP